MPEFKSTLSLLARKFFSVSSLPDAVKCLIGFKLNGLGFFFFFDIVNPLEVKGLVNYKYTVRAKIPVIISRRKQHRVKMILLLHSSDWWVSSSPPRHGKLCVRPTKFDETCLLGCLFRIVPYLG